MPLLLLFLTNAGAFPVVALVLVGAELLESFSQTFGLTVWLFQQQNMRILAFLVELVEKGRSRLLLFYWNIVDLQRLC